jgi:hypothetical protein
MMFRELAVIPSSGDRLSYTNYVSTKVVPYHEELIVAQLVKKSHAVYGTRRHITVFVKASH